MAATITFLQRLLSREDCEKILKRSVGDSAKFLSYKITKFSETVTGFLGDHLSLTITFTTNGSVSKISYFVKTLPQFNTSQLDYVKQGGIFKKEALLYQNLLPDLLEFGQFGPHCYCVKDNLIVLEDLKAKGYKMLPKEIYLDLDHCLSLLQTLARYHSSTLIYEKQQGVKLDESFQDEIKEISFSFVEGDARQKWLMNVTKCVQDLMKVLGADDKICAAFRKFTLEEMEAFLRPSKQFRNVLTHDDLWCNNMLFNAQTECVFVDYQMGRYAPPALDFLLTLFLNVRCDEVVNNLQKFGDFYYGCLVEQLKKFGLDDAELPKDEFQDSLEFYFLPALVEMVMYGTHTNISEDLSNEIVQDLANYREFSFINRSKFAIKEFHTNPNYQDRLSAPLLLLIETLAST